MPIDYCWFKNIYLRIFQFSALNLKICQSFNLHKVEYILFEKWFSIFWLSIHIRKFFYLKEFKYGYVSKKISLYVVLSFIWFYPTNQLFGLIAICVSKESLLLNILSYLRKICILLKHSTWHNKIMIYFQVGENGCFSVTAAWKLVLSDEKATEFYCNTIWT